MSHSAKPAMEPSTVTLRDWVGFLAMVFGMFMAILDIQIVASSLSQLQAGLSASADEISWVQTAYLIAEVVMIPLSGWLARLFSTRILFFVSCLTFTIASVLCALAWNLESMMVFRAIQGFLGGAMIPTVFATSFTLFPRHQSASVTVLVGLVATMAPTLGPTLGGYLTETFHWHWLFLINAVPGMIVCCLVWMCVRPAPFRREMLQHFDGWGIVLAAIFLGTLQYVLEEGNRNDWLHAPHIVGLAALAGMAGVVFIWREWTIEHPVIDIRAFHDRNFAVGCLYSFIIGIGLYGSVYVIPLYLGRIRGYSALDIGLTMMVTGAFQFLSAPLAGTLARVMDLRLLLGIGMALFGGGLWLNHALTPAWGFWDLFLPQAVRGLSLMFCFVPINTVALGHLPPHEVQNASGLYNLMRNLGGAIGLAAITTALTRRTDLHMVRLGENLTAARAPVTDALGQMSARLSMQLPGDADQAALANLYRLTKQQAMTMAFSDVLLGMSLVFAVGLLLMPLVQKVAHPAAGGAGH